MTLPSNETLQLMNYKGREDLFYPDLQRNIAQIAPTALTLLKKKFPLERTLLPHLAEKSGWQQLASQKISKVIYIILDAIGSEQFYDHANVFKKRFSTNGLVVSSVYPTITSTCIPSLQLGQMPVKHGILGHKIYFKEINNIVNTLNLYAYGNRGCNLTKAGVDVRPWQWSEELINTKDNIIDVRLIENEIANKGLSLFLTNEEPYIGYSSHVDCFACTERILEKNRNNKLFLNIYIGSTDSIAHRFTPSSDILSEEIQNIESLLLRLFQRLDPEIAKETAFIITSDHGQETIKEERKIIVSEEEREELDRYIHFYGRSGRIIHFYTKKEKQEDFIQWLEKKIDSKGVIATPKDYPLLLGPGSHQKEVLNRLGEVQLILGAESAIYFGHSGNFDLTYDLDLNATHGSLTKSELLVPFFFDRVANYR
jgi:hypothetical protein